MSGIFLVRINFTQDNIYLKSFKKQMNVCLLEGKSFKVEPDHVEIVSPWCLVQLKLHRNGSLLNSLIDKNREVVRYTAYIVYNPILALSFSTNDILFIGTRSTKCSLQHSPLVMLHTCVILGGVACRSRSLPVPCHYVILDFQALCDSRL